MFGKTMYLYQKHSKWNLPTLCITCSFNKNKFDSRYIDSVYSYVCTTRVKILYLLRESNAFIRCNYRDFISNKTNRRRHRNYHYDMTIIGLSLSGECSF